MVRLLCFFLYLFDALIGLHAMNEKDPQMTFSSEIDVDFICNICLFKS